MQSCRLAFAFLFVSSAAFGQIAPANATPTNGPSPGHLAIVADGTIQNVFAGKDQTSPAFGSLGFAFTSGTGRERFSAYLTVAKAIDTLRGHTQQTFGRALLTPGGTSPAGVSSFSADYQRFYNYGTVNQRFGPRTYLAYAQTTWQYDNPQNPVSNDLGIVSGGVRAFWVAINLPNTTNSFSFTPEVGATFRKLTGNGADNAVLMQQALGTTNTFFWGPELLVTIQVRQLSGFFKLTMLGKPNGATIDGLTGTQGIFGFALDAPIFVW